MISFFHRTDFWIWSWRVYCPWKWPTGRVYGQTHQWYARQRYRHRILFWRWKCPRLVIKIVKRPIDTLYTFFLAPGDYNQTAMNLTFGPGISSLPVIVPVVDDSLVENDETLFGNLRLPEGVEDLGNILFRPGRAMATIQDSDSKQHDRECNVYSSHSWDQSKCPD